MCTSTPRRRPHHSKRAEAALLFFHDKAFASHASVGRIHDVPLPTIPDEHVAVSEHTYRRRLPGIKLHVRSRAWVTEVDGVRVSDPAQMFIELAGLVGLVDVVVVGDNLVRRGSSAGRTS